MCAWRKVAACLLPCILVLQASHAEERITLYFNERPPYIVEADNGSVSGLTATPATNAFQAAGVPFVWLRMPTSRQFLNIERNIESACMVGVYRNAEREQYAKYTKPIYRGRKTVALTHRSLEIADGAKLDDVMARKGLRVLIKDRYSYGDQVDALLARHRPELVRTTNENVSMAKMLGMKQADLMFMSEEEALAIIDKLGAPGVELRIVRFPDLPRAPERYIMCSKQVPDAVIKRINQVIN